MKNNITIKSIVALTLITVLLYSCSEDFYNFKQYGAPNTTTFWETEADAIDARNALTNYTAREGIDGRGHIWLENCSDNLVTGRKQPQAKNIKNFVMSAENGRDWKYNWKQFYQIIAIANGILKNVPSMKISQKVKNNVIGEAYFYRAFSYLWLAPWYADNDINGGIPIITENTLATDLDQPRPKSVLANYDMIIEDMEKASNLLGVFAQQPKGEYGRPHKAAAYGFAARAALYAAQYDAKYYNVVLEMTQKVMGLGGALYPDYAKLFTIENNFSSEYIFSMLGSAFDGPKFAGMSFQNGGWGLYNTWGYFQPTLELYNAYESGDKRRDATILYPGQHIKFMSRDIHFGVAPAGISSTSGMTFRKWMDPFKDISGVGKIFNPSGDNHTTKLALPLLRYADILLMRAEALIWSKGEGNGEAVQLLNQIRRRAGLPENSQATKAQLKNERRCELAFEFLPSRFIDLVRWKDYDKLEQPLHGIKVDAVVNEVPITSKTQVWPARKFNPQKNHVFPIPSKEVSDKFKLKQNVGY